jgi:hypothetical protein
LFFNLRNLRNLPKFALNIFSLKISRLQYFTLNLLYQIYLLCEICGPYQPGWTTANGSDLVRGVGVYGEGVDVGLHEVAHGLVDEAVAGDEVLALELV